MEISNLTKLNQLPKGTTAIITSLTANGLMRRRLMDLGFTEGAKVTVIRKSPIGDPTAYRIRGAVIALRKEEAALIEVQSNNLE